MTDPMAKKIIKLVITKLTPDGCRPNCYAILGFTILNTDNNIKVTNSAVRYSATKGAISTMVTNLTTKSLVKKCRLPENEREVLLSLTELGLRVFEEKEAHSQDLYTDIDAHLQILTPE